MCDHQQSPCVHADVGPMCDVVPPEKNRFDCLMQCKAREAVPVGTERDAGWRLCSCAACALSLRPFGPNLLPRSDAPVAFAQCGGSSQPLVRIAA